MAEVNMTLVLPVYRRPDVGFGDVLWIEHEQGAVRMADGEVATLTTGIYVNDQDERSDDVLREVYRSVAALHAREPVSVEHASRPRHGFSPVSAVGE